MAFSELSRPWHARGDYNPRGGVLLCHGFTGAPQSMRPWAEHLHAEGFEIGLPLLPGHARTWQEMARTTRHDWFGEVRAAALALLEHHRTIAVAGLSMGGTLSLALAQDPEVGPRIHALALVNPAVTVPRAAQFSPLLWPLIPSLPAIASDLADPDAIEEGYDRTPMRSIAHLTALTAQVRRALPRVAVPMLLATSPTDHVVDPADSRIIAGRVRGRVQRMRLSRSHHVATLDHDAAAIFAASVPVLDGGAA